MVGKGLTCLCDLSFARMYTQRGLWFTVSANRLFVESARNWTQEKSPRWLQSQSHEKCHHPCMIMLNLAFIINTQGSCLLLEIHNTSTTTKTRVTYIISYLAYVQIQVHKLHQRYILTGFSYSAVFPVPVPCKHEKVHHDTLDHAILLRREHFWNLRSSTVLV